MPRARAVVSVLVALGVLAFAAQQARAQEAESTAPVFVSARTDTSGENIIVTFSEAVTINPAATLISNLHNVPVLDLIRGVLSVTIDGREDLLSGAAVSGSELTIRVAAPRIEAGQAVSVASDTVFARDFAPLLVDADGNPVSLFSSQSVQNLSVIPRGPRVAAGLVVSSNYLRTAEGQTERYTVRLPSQPPGDVTVELLVWRLGAVRVEPHQMTFTSSNWNVPQVATVLTDSDDDSQDIWTVILHTRSDASLGRAAAIVRLIVDDEDELLRVSGSSTPEYTENATTTVATYVTPWTLGVAWSLFGADRDYFSINREGDLSFVAPPDYEDPADAHADNVYQVSVQASDGSATGFLAVSVTVTDLNEPPDVFGPVGVGVEEGSGTWVGAYTHDDPEDGAATWSLAGSDHHHFTFTDGELRFREAPDFESPADANGNNRYEVTVLAEDGGDLPGTRRVTVSVIDVNEEPSIDGPANVAYAENGTGAVATFTATDPEQHTILWSLSGADAGDFTITGGALRFVEAPDYERRADAGGNSAYGVTVHASDGAQTATQAVTVTLVDEDETGALVLSSGQPQAGTLLAATHTDADGIVNESWSWARSTNRSDWSAIAGATTNRYTPTGADLSHYVRVTVQYDDGHGPGKRRSSVSDRRVRARPAANRAPEFPSPAAARSLPENRGRGTSVGARVAATDADGDLLRYSLSGPGAEAFVIDGATGTIRVAPGRLLNHEAQSSYSVTVTATDPSNARAAATVTIAIEDVNEAPTAVGDTASTNEGEAASIDVLHNDADPEGGLLTVSLESAPEGGAATVEADGAITYTPPPDHHGPDAFTYSISDGEHSATATVIVNVRAVNDAPAFPTASTVRFVDSRAPARTRVGPPVAAIDQNGDQVTYRLSGRAAGAFDIDEHTGQLRLRAGTVLDPAEQDSYRATVTATDPSGATASINVTITVTAPSRSRSDGPSRPPSSVDFEWTVEHDLDELDAHNEWPAGLWSGGTTFWITEAGPDSDGSVYAYDLASGERRERAEFDLDERNRAPRGLSSDRETAWISNHDRNRLYAYDLASGERAEHRDIVLDARNRDAHGLWSDDETVWVVDGERAAVFAYDLGSGDFLAEYRLDFANDDPRGVWSDGVTVWVSDDGAKRLFAYRLPVPRQAGATRLERVAEEDFGELILSQASNNSPRGIWSDGGVMYVADEHDGRVYSYNMPDAIDARLASLTLGGIDIGEFSPTRSEYAAVAPTGVTETTVDPHAEQPGTGVEIAPPDADARASGHQVAIADGVEVTVTVTSTDGSRKGVYRVWIAPGPAAPCLRGAVDVGVSLLTYAGGSVEELASCAEGRHVTALYATRDGAFVTYILGAPDFVNRAFRELYADGIPINTPLLAQSDGPASPDINGEGGTQP